MCWLGLVVVLAGSFTITGKNRKVLAGSFTITGKNRKVLAGVGRHAGWSSCWFVVMLVGRHAGWSSCWLVADQYIHKHSIWYIFLLEGQCLA